MARATRPGGTSKEAEGAGEGGSGPSGNTWANGKTIPFRPAPGYCSCMSATERTSSIGMIWLLDLQHELMPVTVANSPAGSVRRDHTRRQVRRQHPHR